jgi:predicted nucleotidyltransferase
VRSTLPSLAEELETTDRTLRRAISQGLIRATRPSPRTLELSPAERTYLRSSWQTLVRLRSALRTEPGVGLAVLFGSRARGDQRPESDVDLLVAVADASKVHQLGRRLEAVLGLPIGLVLLEDARRAPLLMEQVVREGRVLVDRQSVWPEIDRRRGEIRRAAARERQRIDEQFDAAFGAG